MASSAVQSVIQSWKKFNLPQLQKELDEQASELAEQQDKNDSSRKILIEQSREFKKTTPEDIRKMVAPLLKSFQQEIDSLYKRSKSAEVAFLAVYKKVLDISDPIPALELYVSTQQKVSKLADLEIETKQLRETLRDYNQEFKDVKNQEVTIKQLREKIKDYEESIDKQVKVKVKAAEKELLVQFSTKEKHLEEELENLKKKYFDAEQRVASFQSALTGTQSELFELKSTQDEHSTARSDEMEILMNDLDKANQRASMAEKELAEMKEQMMSMKQEDSGRNSGIDIVHSSDLIRQSSFEMDLESKEREIAQLVVDLQKLQMLSNKEKEESERQIKELSTKVVEQASKIDSLVETVNERQDYMEMKNELRILRAMEFSSGDDQSKSTESKPLEVLLLEKNKSLNSGNTILRMANEEANLKTKELSKDYMEAVSTLQEQQGLIRQLEKDLANMKLCSSFYRGEGEGQAAQPLASELVAEAVKEVSDGSPIPEPSNAAESLLPIVTSQRERFRQRNEELESYNSMQQQQIGVLQGDVDQLRSDNIKLYEKIKFLQSFPSQRPSHSDDMESRYSSQYEAKLDPFSSFSRKERQRKYMNLSPFEKITLGMGRAILSSKVARTFAFIYTLLVHSLIFLVLYKLAHTESCKRDFASECQARFAEHMKEVHGQALEHGLNSNG